MTKLHQVQLAPELKFDRLVELFKSARANKDERVATAAEAAVLKLGIAEAAIAEANVLAAFAHQVSTP